MAAVPFFAWSMNFYEGTTLRRSVKNFEVRTEPPLQRLSNYYCLVK